MNILTRFRATTLIRASALLSVLAGLLYLLSAFQLSLQINLGPEMEEGKVAAHTWATYALIGGVALLAGSYLIQLSQSPLTRRIMLSIALIGITVLIVGQLPPLFYWFLFSITAFSWSNALGFALHAGLISFGFWGMLAIFYTLERHDRT